MNTPNINPELINQLKNEKYHDAFLQSQIKNTVAFQMRALRAQRNFTQKDLADLTSTKQSVISRIENKGALTLSIRTLLKLASAFNVGLVVRFEPIDKLLEWEHSLSSNAISPRKSRELLFELEKRQTKTAAQKKATVTNSVIREMPAQIELFPSGRKSKNTKTTTTTKLLQSETSGTLLTFKQKAA